MELRKWEGSLTSCSDPKQGQLRSDRDAQALSSQVLKTFNFRDCAVSLGKLLQCLIILKAINFLLYIQLKPHLFKFIPVFFQPPTIRF